MIGFDRPPPPLITASQVSAPKVLRLLGHLYSAEALLLLNRSVKYIDLAIFEFLRPYKSYIIN